MAVGAAEQVLRLGHLADVAGPAARRRFVADRAVAEDVDLASVESALDRRHRVLECRQDAALDVEGPLLLVRLRTDRLDATVDEGERQRLVLRSKTTSPF